MISIYILPPLRPKCRIVDKVDSLFHQRNPQLCASSLRIAVVLSVRIIKEADHLLMATRVKRL